jgi:undecaprenyl-diphosphatase
MLPSDASSTIHSLAGRFTALDGLMKFAAEYLLYGAAVIFVVLWLHNRGLRSGLAGAMGAVAAVGLGAVIGALWSEQRPFVADHFVPLVAHSADASFPSDHLLALGGVAGGCWVAARRLAVATIGLACVVGFARVFVGVHYVGDVVAGFGIGFTCGLLAWVALGPAEPLIAHVDVQLRRWRLRPAAAQLGGPTHKGGS